MSFNFSLRGYVPPYAGNLGEAQVVATATGAYAPASFRPGTVTTSVRNGIGPVSLRLSDIRYVNGLPAHGGLRAQVYNQFVRFGPVTAATISGSTVTVTVATGHNIQTGEAIRLRQVVGSVELNAGFGPINTTTGAPIVRRVSNTVFTISGVTAITAFGASADSIVEVRRPFAALTLASFNVTTNVFATSAAHNLQKGDVAITSQVTGLTGAPWLNRSSIVNTVPSATTFTVLQAGVTTGVATGGVVIPVRTTNNFGTLKVVGPRTLAIASVTAANPAVYTIIVNHGLAIGDRVFVSGIQGITLGTSNAGYAVVRTVPSATTFTLEDEAGLPITSAGATITANTGTVSVDQAEYTGATLEQAFLVEVTLMANNPSDGIFIGPFNA